ncbi:MAG: 4Fe-4S binding protein [bacterium]
MISHRIVIKYPPRLVDKPVLCRLARDFGLDFNILRAQVSPETGGLMVLEISGEPRNYREAMQRFEDEGITTQMLSRDIVWDESRCTQCGVCVTLCPSGALTADPVTRLVSYDAERCAACEYCVNICPVQALQVLF